jgi:integrative and conjugative element protein (TIGR02256 family)
MDRKHRNSCTKKHKSRFIIKFIKAHVANTPIVRVKHYNFEIKQEVIDDLKSFAQNEGNEQCGVLTGVQIGRNCYRVSKVSPACVKSSSRCSCIRDSDLANKFIAEDYKLSKHTRFYIGEWHTHPESNPSPSPVDCQSIIDNFQTSAHVAPFLIMIIVGTEGFYICLYNGVQFVEVIPTVV